MQPPRHKLRSLDATVAAEVVAASGDVAMLLDRDGVIRDLTVNNEAMILAGVDEWIGKSWSDTVAGDSRHKVEAMMRDAQAHAASRWREVHHAAAGGDPFTLRYLALDAGLDGHVVAIGRDDRATAALQQRLQQAQQAIEREYARLRDAEARYRLLFQVSAEAVLIIDGGTRKVLEANPAAQALFGEGPEALAGRPFAKLFDAAGQDAAASLLTVAQSTSRTSGAQAAFKTQTGELTASASLFRQDRREQFLVRLAPAGARPEISGQPDRRLAGVMERMPEAFVVTDEGLTILEANTAFLDLVRVASAEQARGQSLTRYLGRSAVDRNILVANLKEHGQIRNFSTVLQGELGDEEEVEISAVVAPDPQAPVFGFTLRQARRDGAAGTASPALGRSVAQLTELIGRVSLKDLVRDTTDLVERLCIEAALELTGNNRASAAQVLGLSRQSLYSKLHRYELGPVNPDE